MSFTGLAPQGTAKGIVSADITDLTITNADISDTASINWKKLMTDTQGRILYINAAGEVSGLAVGTSGQYAMSQGAGANPVFTTVTSGLTSSTGVNKVLVSGGALGSNDVTIGTVTIPAGSFSGRSGHVFVQWSAKGAGAGGVTINYTINAVANAFEFTTLSTESHGHLHLSNTPSGALDNSMLWGEYQTTTGAYVTFGSQNADHNVDNPLTQEIAIAFILDANMSGMMTVWY